MPAQKSRIQDIKVDQDLDTIWEKILQWSEDGWESIPDDEIDLTKWYGLFYRKPTPGYFMIRVRVPGGVLQQGEMTSVQLRELAEITREYGRDIMEVTTRQQVELRWIRIEDFPEIFRRLRAVGLDSRQTGMDNIRGVTTCPVAGLAADEIIDTRNVVKEMNDGFVGKWRYADLPRKFNITIIGCPDDCTHAETNDIGMTPAVKEGVYGFNVRVAGGEGSWGRQHATPLDAFVTEDEAVELGLRILDVFSDNGQREKRNKARMKFLLDDWGIEKFREEVAARLTYELKTAGEELTRREPGPRDHIGVGQQKDEGLRYVGLLVPTGRMQLHQIFELARVAEEYGNGEVRLTSQQNVLVPNVPEERLEEFLAEPILEELSPKPNPFMRGLVTCIGKNFCPVSLIDTKEQGRKLAQYLDDRLGPEVEEAMGVFRIHTSGCVNSCARPHTGHVGLIGKQVKRNGESVDGANIQLGGEQGLDGGFNEKWQQKVDFEEMAPKIEAVIRRYLDEREPEENFRDWCLRTGTVVPI